MDKNPLISVVIPTYNDSACLRGAIDSALAQEYRPLEVVVVDDGSDDGGATAEILRQYEGQLRAITTQNHGVAAARNTGVAAAKGEYIAFLDADDVFCPGKLQKQLADMLAGRREVSHTSYRRVDTSGRELGYVSTAHHKGRVFPDLIGGCNVATPTVMARRAVLLEHPFPEGMHIGEDVCVWIDLSAQYEFAQLDEALTEVRIAEDTAAFSYEKQLLGLANILQYAAQNPEYARQKRQLRRLVKLINQLLKSRTR